MDLSPGFARPRRGRPGAGLFGPRDALASGLRDARALEIVVVVGAAGLATLALYRNFGRALSEVSFDGVGFEGGRITMDRPRLTGARPGGGGYNITAAKAMQDAKHPGEVDLALIGGEIVRDDKEISRLTASSGHYVGADETLDLVGDVRLLNPRYQFFLRSVHVAFKTGDYASAEPVEARILPDTLITANAVRGQGERRRSHLRRPSSHRHPGKGRRARPCGAMRAAVILCLVVGFWAGRRRGGRKKRSAGGDSAGGRRASRRSRSRPTGLDYFEKEGKAVYNGHVVVVQGDTRLTCSRLAIFMEKSGQADAEPKPPAGVTPAADASSGLKHMDCAGPVKVVSKTQTATSENGSYDKGRSEVVLSGHVVLTDGRNVTKGDRPGLRPQHGAGCGAGRRRPRAGLLPFPAAPTRPAP